MDGLGRFMVPLLAAFRAFDSARWAGGSALKTFASFYSFQQEVYNGIKQFRFFVLVFFSQVVQRCRCATNHAVPSLSLTLFPKYNPHIVKSNNAHGTLFPCWHPLAVFFLKDKKVRAPNVKTCITLYAAPKSFKLVCI